MMDLEFPGKIRTIVPANVSAFIWAIWKTDNVVVFDRVVLFIRFRTGSFIGLVAETKCALASNHRGTVVN
jgi:hypothetical protein